MEGPQPSCDSKLVHLDPKSQPQNLVMGAMECGECGSHTSFPKAKAAPPLYNIGSLCLAWVFPGASGLGPGFSPA